MVQTEIIVIMDFLKWEQPFHFCRELKTIKAVGGATDGDQPIAGNLMEDDTGLIIVATAANTIAVLLESLTLAEYIAGCEKVCLVRGPAIIDSDRITCTAGEKVAALVVLLALGIKSTTEPDELTEGTDS